MLTSYNSNAVLDCGITIKSVPTEAEEKTGDSFPSRMSALKSGPEVPTGVIHFICFARFRGRDREWLYHEISLIPSPSFPVGNAPTCKYYSSARIHSLKD